MGHVSQCSLSGHQNTWKKLCLEKRWGARASVNLSPFLLLGGDGHVPHLAVGGLHRDLPGMAHALTSV